MSHSPYEISPVVGATAAVAIGAAYVIYKSSASMTANRKPHVSPCPVKKLHGSVTVNVNDIKCSEERKRDLLRFYKSESIFLRTRGGEVEKFKLKNLPQGETVTPDLIIRDLVRIMPKGTDLDGLVYSLSTSIGMDVLIKIGVNPPMVSQPICVIHVASGEVEMLGFIGKDLKGERPDSKYTDWLIKMKLAGGNRVEYEVFKMFRRKAKYIDDPTKPAREEFKKYQLTLQIIKRTVEGFEFTLSQMNPAHDELQRNLQELFNAENGQRTLNYAAMLSAHAKAAFDESKPMYIELKDKVDKLAGEISYLDRQIQDREKAYAPMIHYQKKIEKLKANEKAHGSDKMERNLRKSAAASNTWNELDATVVRELTRVLENRLKTVSEILDIHTAHLNRYYDICSKKIEVLPPTVAAVVEAPASPSVEKMAEEKLDIKIEILPVEAPKVEEVNVPAATPEKKAEKKASNKTKNLPVEAPKAEEVKKPVEAPDTKIQNLPVEPPKVEEVKVPAEAITETKAPEEPHATPVEAPQAAPIESKIPIENATASSTINLST